MKYRTILNPLKPHSNRTWPTKRKVSSVSLTMQDNKETLGLRAADNWIGDALRLKDTAQICQWGTYQAKTKMSQTSGTAHFIH